MIIVEIEIFGLDVVIMVMGGFGIIFGKIINLMINIGSVVFIVY